MLKMEAKIDLFWNAEYREKDGHNFYYQKVNRNR
jgi:hypothetical protein